MTTFRHKVRNFLFPPHGSPRLMYIIPYAFLTVLIVSLFVGGAYGWDYTNSSTFCGTSCHTMPPEYAAYQISPHARIACVECHIGREFIGNQIFRKAGDLRHVFATLFVTYEYPITIKNMRPAPEICEKCHSPEKFSDDSLRVVSHFHDDMSAYNLYLILKTGGGAKREGLGRGIHWHIENTIYYYPTDAEAQTIPYVKVMQDDGSAVEYMDVEADFDPASIDETQLRQMDCITCHNRITHRVYTPEESLDSAFTLGKIAKDIPGIRQKGVEVLRGEYASQEEGLKAIGELDTYYKNIFPKYYSSNPEKVEEAIEVMQKIYTDSVFIEQKVNWDSHPTNVGHINSPGCFRCHDGKHLNAADEAIRLECNLCHSIPIVSNESDFVTNIEISRGLEPETHFNPNWISMHNQAIGPSCSNCHTTKDPGGTSDTSFCSNSACHGNVYTYAGFDAPALREIIKSQLPPAEPELEVPVLTGDPTYANYAGILFTIKCTGCHTEGDSAPKGLDLSTYISAMKGGEDGAVIVPGDSANSLLVQIQSADHFTNFTSEELNNIIKWIDAGAPEN
ncbi:MAG TPA: NapC/NirT family cytochrome c [Anaerolineales bacterium]|nr:NapC/NirT family cytochrome c [Anaerolineales bacterium]